MALLPPVVATLLADTKEYTAKMDEATGKMEAFGAAADTSGSKFGAFAAKASTAVIGVGVALGAYAVDKAFKFQEGLDKIQNQANITASQLNRLSSAILNISSSTGVTTSDLETAALAVYQAGIKGQAAINLLSSASKAAVVTGTNVTTVTQSLIAVEALHFQKLKSIGDLTGALVAGSKDYVGGLSAEASVLSGRVGVALANYGINIKTAISLGAQFAKVGLPTRSVASFVQGLGKLIAPMEQVNATTGKSSLTTYAQTLQTLDLNQQKLVSDLRTGNIAGILENIKTAADASGKPLAEYFNAVFGSSAGGVANLLSKSTAQIQAVQQAVASGNSTTLSSGFSEALKQIGPQLKLLMAQVDVLFIQAGKYLLPKLTDVVHWANDVIDYFKKHPLVAKIASDAAIALFVSSIALKLGSAISGIFAKGAALFGGEGAAAGVAGGEGAAAVGGGEAVAGIGADALGVTLGTVAGPLIAAAIATAFIAQVIPAWYKQQLNQTASGIAQGANIPSDLFKGHYKSAGHDALSFLDGLADILPGIHYGEGGSKSKGKLTIKNKASVKAR